MYLYWLTWMSNIKYWRILLSKFYNSRKVEKKSSWKKPTSYWWFMMNMNFDFQKIIFSRFFRFFGMFIISFMMMFFLSVNYYSIKYFWWCTYRFPDHFIIIINICIVIEPNNKIDHHRKKILTFIHTTTEIHLDIGH